MGNLKLRKRDLRFPGIVSILVLSFGSVAWASTAGGGVHNSWLEIDTWKVLNFTILVLGGFFIARKPVAEFFSSRKKDIADELSELDQKKKDAEKKLAEYEAKFKNLDQESKQIIEDYIKQGEEAQKRILKEARAQADKLEDMAKRTIEQEFKAAKATLQREIVEKAMAQAEAVIKDSISSEDQDNLVDQYLKKVVA
ncbi:MAG: F0F1 ATP synthase subunit B [Desulfobacteraceae bacterium]|nr:F0F1 ATP synthase subunit B [Desulfobacteraceae bacterium]